MQTILLLTTLGDSIRYGYLSKADHIRATPAKSPIMKYHYSNRAVPDIIYPVGMLPCYPT